MHISYIYTNFWEKIDDYFLIYKEQVEVHS
jgi:hypothetical protein